MDSGDIFHHWEKAQGDLDHSSLEVEAGSVSFSHFTTQRDITRLQLLTDLKHNRFVSWKEQWKVEIEVNNKD